MDSASLLIFWEGYGLPTVIIVAQIVAIIVVLLLSVAYLTLAERKVLSAMQMRIGPNVVGPFGMLQPIADGMKLMFKETIVPAGANRVVFIAAPMLTFILAMIAWPSSFLQRYETAQPLPRSAIQWFYWAPAHRGLQNTRGEPEYRRIGHRF